MSSTRPAPKKLKGASDEQVRQQQLGEIGFFEKRALRKVVAAADGRAKDFHCNGSGRMTRRRRTAWPMSSSATRSRRSIRILEAALVKGCGQLDLARVKGKAGR